MGPLADNECRHGSLPDDKVVDCNCWDALLREARPMRALDFPAPSAMPEDWTPLRRRRAETGLSARQVARMTGVDHGVISKIELGHRTPPLDLAHTLASVLRCRVPDIFPDLRDDGERAA